jgi:hypothetical protein
MAVQARRVQIIIACNMIARLTRSEPSVNFSAFDMLTCCCIFLSRYSPYFLPLIKRPPRGGVRPKYPVMRKSSRHHIGTAIAFSFE